MTQAVQACRLLMLVAYPEKGLHDNWGPETPILRVPRGGVAAPSIARGPIVEQGV